MKELEAQIIIENEGYEDDEVEEVLVVYRELMKNVGFEDKRRDKRFVVKFHDIYYYMPEEYVKEHDEEYNTMFSEFCNMSYDWIVEDANENGIDMDTMLCGMCVGHYEAFRIDIPNITEENALQLALDIHMEVPYSGDEYVRGYIHLVKTLQDLEDNYMEYWIQYLEDNEMLPDEVLKEIKDKYNADKERRK